MIVIIIALPCNSIVMVIVITIVIIIITIVCLIRLHVTWAQAGESSWSQSSTRAALGKSQRILASVSEHCSKTRFRVLGFRVVFRV